jgi:hypothetical protein
MPVAVTRYPTHHLTSSPMYPERNKSIRLLIEWSLVRVQLEESVSRPVQECIGFYCSGQMFRYKGKRVWTRMHERSRNGCFRLPCEKQ